MTLGDDLRDDRERYFFRAHGADVETDRGTDVSELFFGAAALPESFDDYRRASLAANQANVVRVSTHNGLHALFIFIVTSRHHGD